MSTNPTEPFTYEQFDALTAKTRPKTCEAVKHAIPPKTRAKLLRGDEEKISNCLIDLSLVPEGQSRSEKCYHLVALYYEAGFDRDRTWNEVKDVSVFAEKGEPWFDLAWEKIVGRHAQKQVAKRQRALQSSGQPAPVPAAHSVDGQSPPDDNATKLAQGWEQIKLERMRQFCDTFKCDVLGKTPEGHIFLYSQVLGDITEISDIGRFSHPRFVQALGMAAVTRMTDVESEGSGLFSVRESQVCVALLASQRPVIVDGRLGVGIWPIKERGIPTGELALVAGKRTQVFDTSTKLFTALSSPFYKDCLIDPRGDPATDLWLEPTEVQAAVDRMAEPDTRKQLIDRLQRHFSQWPWADSRNAGPIVTGLVLASFVQTVWPWRPLVAILGPAGSGKTLLLQQLIGLFGPLAFEGDRPSEAAIRQGLGNQARVLFSDEFEHNPHRQRVYDLLRTSSRGANSIRGGADHKLRSFRLRHIVWLAAIGLGLEREPDRTRFIELMMTRASKEWGTWTPAEAAQIRTDCLACALVTLSDALPLSETLAQACANLRGGRRFAENYAVPMSMYMAAMGVSGEEAISTFRAALGSLIIDAEQESDEEALLRAILRCLVHVGPGETRTVGEILSTDSHHFDPYHASMERELGVAVLELTSERRHRRKVADIPELERYVFVAGKVLKRGGAMRDTEWGFQDVNQILRRFEVASKSKRYVAGNQEPGVALPWLWVKEHFLGRVD